MPQDTMYPETPLKHFRMGQIARDKISKFQGVVTGVTQYQTGMWNVIITPQTLNNGTPVEPQSFEEVQCEHVTGVHKDDSPLDGDQFPCNVPKFALGEEVTDTRTDQIAVINCISWFLHGCCRYGAYIKGETTQHGQPIHVAYDEVYLTKVDQTGPPTKADPSKPKRGGPEIQVPRR